MFYILTDPPVFNSHATHHIEIIEGKSLTLNMTARGNPTDITYTLIKDGAIYTSSSVAVHSGMLEMSNIMRADAGSYSLKAENTEGSRNHNFSINVTCKMFMLSLYIRH